MQELFDVFVHEFTMEVGSNRVIDKTSVLYLERNFENEIAIQKLSYLPRLCFGAVFEHDIIIPSAKKGLNCSRWKLLHLMNQWGSSNTVSTTPGHTICYPLTILQSNTY